MRNDLTGPDSIKQAVMAELGRDDALALLAQARVGRVVFSHEALPAVRPVNFALAGADIVFRVRADSQLSAALSGNVVAFEADHFDFESRVGWSVVVVGLTELVGPGAEFDRLAPDLPEPWAPGWYDRVVRIRVELVTGRRITRVPAGGG